MSDGVVRRREKSVEVVGHETGSAKVLKFDRRSGVVMVEKTRMASRSRSILHLVQDLLKILRQSPSGLVSRRRRRSD